MSIPKSKAIGKVKQRTNIGRTDGALYRLRAMEMLGLKIKGYSNAELMAHFDVGQDVVTKSLSYAMREGLVKEYENRIISELVPAAIEVYKNKLLGRKKEDGTYEEGHEPDPYVAKDIIDKLVKLGDRFEVREQTVEEITLKGYLDEKRAEWRDKRKQQPPATNITVIPAATPAQPTTSHSTKLLPVTEATIKEGSSQDIDDAGEDSLPAGETN